MLENIVNGPENAVVSGMIKPLPQTKLRHLKMFFKSGSWSWTMRLMEDCEARYLAITRCSTKERDPKLQGYCPDVSDVEVVCGVYYSPSLKAGSSCTWVELMSSVVNTFK